MKKFFNVILVLALLIAAFFGGKLFTSVKAMNNKPEEATVYSTPDQISAFGNLGSEIVLETGDQDQRYSSLLYLPHAELKDVESLIVILNKDNYEDITEWTSAAVIDNSDEPSGVGKHRNFTLATVCNNVFADNESESFVLVVNYQDENADGTTIAVQQIINLLNDEFGSTIKNVSTISLDEEISGDANVVDNTMTYGGNTMAIDNFDETTNIALLLANAMSQMVCDK